MNPAVLVAVLFVAIAVSITELRIRKLVAYLLALSILIVFAELSYALVSVAIVSIAVADVWTLKALGKKWRLPQR